MVLVATGSEVSLAVETKKLLEAEGERVRVVSALCLERFARESPAYRDSVLPAGVPRVSIEIGVTPPWRGIVGDRGLSIGLDHFGASAPAKTIAKELGFVPDAVAAKIRAWKKG
jgi:transketolase